MCVAAFSGFRFSRVLCVGLCCGFSVLVELWFVLVGCLFCGGVLLGGFLSSCMVAWWYWCFWGFCVVRVVEVVCVGVVCLSSVLTCWFVGVFGVSIWVGCSDRDVLFVVFYVGTVWL